MVFVLCFHGIGYSQEICDNGIDDDGDLLIDLNDIDDCTCNNLVSTSTLPNPSFEDKTCCPTAHMQLNCANNWMQASEPTSDYLNTCGYMGNTFATDFPSPPDGEGFVGFFNGDHPATEQWKEYIGTCLSETLTANTEYTLSFQFTGAKATTENMNITLFGTTDCSNLPFGNGNSTFGCPTNGPGWVKLGSILIDPDNAIWQTEQIVFTPTQDIIGIVFGPPCPAAFIGDEFNPAEPYDYYYLVDDLVLMEVNLPTPEITISGNKCDNNTVLTALPNTAGNTYQWYNEGIALVGETNSNYNILPNTSGKYQVMSSSGTTCAISDTIAIDVAASITTNLQVAAFDSIQINNYWHKSDTLLKDTLLSSKGCDSIINTTVVIEVKNLECTEQEVFIPTGISPNEDGVNDQLCVFGKECITSFELKIYDRWGNELYQSTNKDACWNGTYEGIILDNTVFVYQLEAILTTKEVITQKGNISLIK